MKASKIDSDEVAGETVTLPTLPPISNNMTEEEKQRVVSSDDYVRFMERASLVMERALADTTDILFDLSGRQEEDNEE